MKSQVLTTAQPSMSWPFYGTLKKISGELRSDVNLPVWLKNIPSLSRTFLTLSTLLLLLGGKIGYSDTLTRVKKPLGPSFSWLSSNPSDSNSVEQNKVVEVIKPTLPCAPEIINLNENWISQCPDLSITFAKLANGPIDRKIFNVYSGSPEANREAQLYTDDTSNLSVSNGSLTIRALNKQTNGYSYTSARIDTKGKKDFQYGRLQIEATLPNNIGAWPAIWMMSTNRKYEGLSPETNFDRYLNDGEIDIAESVGAQPNIVYGIAHSLAYPAGESRDYYNTVSVPNNNSEFHKYGIDWTPTKLSFTLDGNEYFKMEKQPNADYRSWPYDQPFYLILNLAVGGSWGGINRAQFPPDGVNQIEMPFIMSIRSINYFSYIAS